MSWQRVFLGDFRITLFKRPEMRLAFKGLAQHWDTTNGRSSDFEERAKETCNNVSLAWQQDIPGSLETKQNILWFVWLRD